MNTKNADHFPFTRVADIVTENPLTSRVFHDLGIDFCCHGQDTLESACARKGLELDEIIRYLNETEQGPLLFESGKEATPGEVIDYILNRYHATLKKEIPTLKFLMEKVLKVHGTVHPFLDGLHNQVTGLLAELEMHMMKEEQVLFPMIRQFEATSGSGEPVQLHCGHIQNPISQMEFEHESAGEILGDMRKITSEYTLPQNPCNFFRALYKGLEKLEEDLHLHIHLENNILHPLALKLGG